MKPLITIWLFTFALICGIAASQIADLEPYRVWLFFLTDALLAYIMMEAGLQFVIQKKKWKSYLRDYGIASLAAGLPWIFCFLYFLKFGGGAWEENLLLARFAAPTATGILFAMLTSAGLGMTWLFKKVEVLVILDDLDTVLLLVPIQFLLSGGHMGLVSVALFMVALIIVGWRYMHTLKLPTSRPWLLFYAIVISALTEWLEISYGLEVEVLLPSFILGLMLYNPHLGIKKSDDHEPIILGKGIKFLFMFLVGLLLPKISFDTLTLKSR